MLVIGRQLTNQIPVIVIISNFYDCLIHFHLFKFDVIICCTPQ